ncbi:DUF4926 domain-containing protein [Carnobacterium divergens]|uniref:DUF4926 domain-containing protein n=1 Tax=Carnobacterium divergens TaxID=2748 RepID=UPI001071F572|nr:DUF4926 domain-containing protein [Carnobacterium divergens]TFJ46871.1 DUF4926 domain-containing protein [Carnobacterium divergens]TFJ53835.1 DUF4926 domain-containing protein [Carnobacterium divergens]
MFNEYDVVYSKENINEKISVNTKGVIVMVLDEYSGIYEVEFVDNNNQTIDVTEATTHQLKSSYKAVFN